MPTLRKHTKRYSIMSKETQGKYTEPDILKFKKGEVMRVAGYTQEKELIIVGDNGVYFMTGDTIPKLGINDELPKANAVGCDPDKDEFNDWWELKRRTWGGDDGMERLDKQEILDILNKCNTHLIIAFKAEEVFIAPKGSSHEGQEFRQGISFEIMSDNFRNDE